MSDMVLAFWTRIQNLKTDETGATAVEYGMIVALIAAIIVAVVALLGLNVRQAFTDINTAF